MKTEIELLQEQFEDFKQCSKEIEDFLEKDLQDLSEKLIKKDDEIRHLKEELNAIKSKYMNEGNLIMKLHQEIAILKNKLEEETKSKKSLETLNESYVEKLRILNFKISELESDLNSVQESWIFAKLENEEKEKLKDTEISKLNNLVEDLTKTKRNKEVDFKVNGILNKRTFGGHYRDRLLIGSEVYKYFHEFDEIAQTTILEYFETEVKKSESNQVIIFYGFRSVIRVLYRFIKDEKSWTCYEFSKDGENETVSSLIDSKIIQELYNAGERKKNHYFHSIRFEKSIIQIFDLCEYDQNTPNILDDVIKAAKLNKPVYNICESLFKSGKIILNLNCIDIDSLVRFVGMANSLVRHEKGTQTARCCFKEFTGNLNAVVSYKKELAKLRKKQKIAEDESFAAKVAMINKEKQGKTEVSKDSNPFIQLGTGNERSTSNITRRNREFKGMLNAPELNGEKGGYQRSRRGSSYKFSSSEVENFNMACE